MQSSVMVVSVRYTGNALALRATCTLTLILVGPDPLKWHHGVLVEKQ